MAVLKFLCPSRSVDRCKLASVRSPDDGRHKPPDSYSLALPKTLKFELHILWPKFPNKNIASRYTSRDHPFSEKRR